ncbi:hypothetical protein LQ327_20895 [Actinomycetospora endophytica]|uniref:Transmembrane protein n=1 Tax=Actinomycetospora endophytica TaxID=2291215 RepID=A0ABS8PFQ1_9PSEU|nr:hypothetical protein [Actinomycetospora endophytica]MCD2195834.1 hypothetical protein [Actinomycetospora endophytica]
MTGSLPDRLWTAFVPRRSSLRRGPDRAETVARWVALALLTLAVPILLTLGTAHAHQLRDAATLARATSHPVTATIDRVTSPGGASAGAVDVTATWVAPDGTARTVTGAESAGARVGDRWTAWVDAAGRQVPVPKSDGEATFEGVLVAFWGFLGVAVVLLGASALLHRLLHRHRMRDWDEDLALFRLGRGRGVNG